MDLVHTGLIEQVRKRDERYIRKRYDLQRTAMISEFSQAMDQSVATNEALKLSIEESAETSELLLNTNKQLQTRLNQSIREQARLTRDYESRILTLEARETKVAHTVAEIKVKESDADQTMQQPAEPSQLNAAQKASDKTRRSLAAVVLTAASMFGILGYQNVDANTVQYRPYHQGITVRGELGDPIVAVNDEKVIYSADEIRGYGNVGQPFEEKTTGLYFEMRYEGAAPTPGHLAETGLSQRLHRCLTSSQSESPRSHVATC
jgi:murein DD-endopeptidase MepM/ murein hydrolase activator NlpD